MTEKWLDPYRSWMGKTVHILVSTGQEFNGILIYVDANLIALRADGHERGIRRKAIVSAEGPA